MNFTGNKVSLFNGTLILDVPTELSVSSTHRTAHTQCLNAAGSVVIIAEKHHNYLYVVISVQEFIEVFKGASDYIYQYDNADELTKEELQKELLKRFSNLTTRRSNNVNISYTNGSKNMVIQSHSGDGDNVGGKIVINNVSL